jgi:hypothetical protein
MCHLSLHWFTGAGAASIRLYRQSALDPGLSGRVEVPTAILMPLRDGVMVPAPREWAERSFNVTRWTIMERGGHFPEDDDMTGLGGPIAPSVAYIIDTELRWLLEGADPIATERLWDLNKHGNRHL